MKQTVCMEFLILGPVKKVRFILMRQYEANVENISLPIGQKSCEKLIKFLVTFKDTVGNCFVIIACV